jgi:hypothetical protein
MKPLLRAVIGSCVAVCTIAACSSSDTLLALNVNSTKGEIGSVSAIDVTVTQQGNSPFKTSFAPDLVATGDGGQMLPDKFYRRIALPDSFDKAPADINVSATNSRGLAFSGTAKVTIQPEEAVVATVTLALPVVDAGNNGGDSGAASDGGADAGADAGTRDSGINAQVDGGSDAGARDASADAASDAGDAGV